MALTRSKSLKNDHVNLNTTTFAGGVLRFRAAPAPANADATRSGAGAIIASITLPDPPWAAPANGSAVLAGTWLDPAADATGDIAWFEFVTQSDTGGSASDTTNRRWQGTVTVTGAGGDMTMNSVSIVIGQAVSVTASASSEN